MSVTRRLRVFRVGTTSILMLGVLPSVGLCQTPADQNNDQAPSEAIEEIIVYGEKSLGNLRQEVYRTEENFFALFSALNNDEEFDVKCFYEVPSFTHIRRHVCRANFVKDATAADYAGWRRGQPVIPANTVIMQKKRRLGEKMDLLATEHPELLEALNKYTNAQEVLRSEKDKCEGQLVICRR